MMQGAALGTNDVALGATPAPWRGMTGLILVLGVAGSLAAVWGGPPLGDHEAIVAQCARSMRVSGNWTVPELFGTPFIRKPPLPYWAVAASSYLFANDPRTGLPVTEAAARLPSALAALGTVLLIWRMASVMFNRRVGQIAGLIGASSIFILLYAPNATAEMPLTFFCTWAGYHFWMAVRASGAECGVGGCGAGAARSRLNRCRALHMLNFYIALGLAMLAKGPAPLPLLAVPLAVWWFLEVPLRVLARNPRANAGKALAAAGRAFLPRFKAAFTQLWLIPGLLVFAAFFVPWMFAVAKQHEHAWHLWNWQYLQRAAGDYEDTRPRGPEYYLIYVAAFTLPWLFLLPEALIAPWLRKYAGWRRPLLLCGLWAVVGVAIMSIEPFKKPYYILPSLPPLIVMMATVAYRFYLREPLGRTLGWLAFGGMAAGLTGGMIGGGIYLHKAFPELFGTLMLIVSGMALLLLIATLAFVYHRGWLAMGLTGLVTVCTFNAVWYRCGPVLGDIDDVNTLAARLTEVGVPAHAKVYWADKRPDARLAFYHDRDSFYLTEPSEIVTKMVDRVGGDEDLQEMAIENALKVMKSPEPAYLLVRKRSFQLMHDYEGVEGNALARIPVDPKRPDKDLLIVANDAHGKPASRPM